MRCTLVSPRRFRLGALALVVTVLAALLLPELSSAQGRTDFLNVETPQVHPIEVARVDGHDYLVVTNTPDNSVEIWDTDESIPVAARFLARVPTGLRPGSVRYHEELGRFFVTNFLGDSVTAFEISAPSGPGSLTVQILRTTWVGDEPMDLGFFSFDETDPDTGAVTRRHTLFLTHMTLDGFGWFDAITLLAVAPGLERVNAEVVKTTDRDFDGQPDNIALKEPRAVSVACDNLVLLGMKGGATADFDFDVYFLDLGTGAARDLGGLGSTNFNMAFTVGDDLLVVGGEAQNQVRRDEPVVAAAPTGFVEHTFYLVENACAGTPVIHRRDVNLEPAVIPHQGPSSFAPKAIVGPVPVTAPVAFNKALAQLTSVVPFELDGEPLKAFFTAFGSDRIGVIEPDTTTNPVLWPLRRMPVPVVSGSTNPRSGPRGLAVKYKNTGASSDPGHRLYSFNRLDNSVTVFDPQAEVQVGEFSLNQDPTPAWIRAGQQFLYSADLSGNGFNSCASCHTDARTDGLAWDLGDPSQPAAPIPPLLLDFPFAITDFPADKEWMVTQSLQGLLNWEVAPQNQEWFTNAPYHWRGDRADFTAFNGAFASLLGGSLLTTAEMDAYEEFINSVHYPGNPKQPLTREFSGDLGTDPNNPTLGSGAKLGLKLYHQVRSDFAGACVHCHALPEGSNNRITEVISGSSPFGSHAVVGAMPMETAALRGLFQKEARLDLNGASDNFASPITGLEGMFHTGFVFPTTPPQPQDFNSTATINGFNRFFFVGAMCPGQNPNDPTDDFCAGMVGLNQFVHELDWGVAPVVGVSYTVDLGNVAAPATTTVLNIGEGEARVANAGLAVQASLGGVQRGFFFDPTAPVQAYVEEPGGAVLTRAALLALVTSARDRLIFIATPLGEERRVAAPSGTKVPLPGASPASLVLEAMTPNTAYVDVPLMTTFWAGPTNQWGGSFSHGVRVLQHGLLQDAAAFAGFGLPQVRHDAPRRFRVSGKGIRNGARLRITYHCDASLPPRPPDTTKRPGAPGQVLTCDLELPVYPTDAVSAVGLPVWETAVEAENWLYYSLMLGGANAPGVTAALSDVGFAIPEPPPVGTFSPAAWNWVYVRVINEDGTVGAGGWQRVQIL